MEKQNIRKLLREGLTTKEYKEVTEFADFINFAKSHLDINDDIKVMVVYERGDLITTAYYNLGGLIKVYGKGRGFIDICRSIAHELVHHKQNLEGRLTDTAKQGEDGSEIENEANAKAGVIIRKFGKAHPEIYN